MVPLTDYAGLEEGDRENLQAAVARLVTLAEVICWGLSFPEDRTILEVVVQDEYTHDVIIWSCGKPVGTSPQRF